MRIQRDFTTWHRLLATARPDELNCGISFSLSKRAKLALRTLKNSAQPKDNAAKFAAIFGANLDDVEKAWLASLADPAIMAVSDELVAKIQAELR